MFDLSKKAEKKFCEAVREVYRLGEILESAIKAEMEELDEETIETNPEVSDWDSSLDMIDEFNAWCRDYDAVGR